MSSLIGTRLRSACSLAAGVGLLALAQASTAGLEGTDHDFSSQGWSGGDLCVVCHTAHGGSSVPGYPLWNHSVTQATYTVYSSATLDATVGQPDGTSKLCLSCHDGTVAVDSFGERSGTSFISGGALVGTDISNDHPISFVYDTALATTDGNLFDPATQSSGLGNTIDTDMLFAGKLQCSSCHEVHGRSGLDNFLRKSNAGSALCRTCHNI